MSAEALFAAGYLAVLLPVAAGLERYGRQSTSAWASQVFAGYHRAVPGAVEPGAPEDWPHSEVGRFHLALSAFVSVIALVLGAAELVRHHRPAEAALLAAAAAPHGVLLALLVRRLRRAPVAPPD